MDLPVLVREEVADEWHCATCTNLRTQRNGRVARCVLQSPDQIMQQLKQRLDVCCLELTDKGLDLASHTKGSSGRCSLSPPAADKRFKYLRRVALGHGGDLPLHRVDDGDCACISEAALCVLTELRNVGHADNVLQPLHAPCSLELIDILDLRAHVLNRAERVQECVMVN